MKRLSLAVPAIAAALLITACGSSPSSPSRIGSNTSVTVGDDNEPLEPLANPVDVEFSGFAAQYSQSMIDNGLVAQARADLPAVKEFAKQMIQDNRVWVERIRRMVAPRELPAIIPLTALQIEQRTQLSGLSGSAFDKVYIPMVITSLTEAIARNAAAASSSTGRVSTFALDQVGGLNKHLAMARDLAGRVR